MEYSYHTHTARCHHAVGEDEEYVKAAIDAGIKVLGFSDHAPMPYPGGYVSYYKMTPDELYDYCASLLQLRDKYKGKIDILIGLETEYYPGLWEASLEFWRDYPIDYLILGQHFIHEEGTDASIRPTSDIEKVKIYVDNVITAMKTGLVSYVAHPDLINYVGEDREGYIREMRRLIGESVRLGMPLEYNLLGMAGGRNYPNEIFWREAASLGAPAILGCDSHSPNRVAEKDEILRANDHLAKLNIPVIDKVELKKIK
jgi:histidinol-phosphatase (PHP family)